MSKSMKVLALMLVLLAGVYAVAADAATDYKVGQTRKIALTDKTTIGNTQLSAGEYDVTHLMDGANHVLVFKTGSKEVARVNCKMVDLPKKAEHTIQVIQTKNNERVLSSLTFRGEKYTHEF